MQTVECAECDWIATVDTRCGCESYVASLLVNQHQAEHRLRLTEDRFDTGDSPWWKCLLFRIDGWGPWWRLRERPRWRPWRRWWTS